MLMDWEYEILKMVILLKLIYRLNVLPNKIPTQFFTEVGRLILSSYGNTHTQTG